MSASVVNGYLCYSHCDEAKARAGKDPHPRQDGIQQTNSSGDAPAVTFGGALAARNAVTPIVGSATAASATQRPSIDILA